MEAIKNPFKELPPILLIGSVLVSGSLIFTLWGVIQAGGL
jgi:hypothetical protein